MRVLVVGAGVVGLTVAVRLAEAGFDTHVFARELPLETTSAVAAMGYPHRVGPADRVLPWTATSLKEFEQIAADPASGVVWRRGRELLGEPASDPWWSSAVTDLERVGHVSPPYRDGWTFRAPIIEMATYLGWLSARLTAVGGTVTRMALAALPAPSTSADHPTVVVNCAGLGARALVKDPSVRPVRGQVVVVQQRGVAEWTLDRTGPTYVIPRADDVVVGGTAEEDGWEPRPSPEIAARILGRAAALVPEIEGAEVLAHRVGLCPARPSVRLEAETGPGGGRLVHCYGHGWAGITTSWGCADDVLALVSG